ncbi:MAG: putative quinol monooxygenase [Acidimicrobiales bacterium]
MLIVAGHFDVDPEQRDAFIADREDSMRHSRTEAGCIQYVFSADPLESGRVLLFERWEDKGALAAHLEGMRSGPRPSSDIKIHGMELQQYEISDIGPVGS